MSTCNCGGTERLIFSCSGAADVGELSDRVARKLAKDGKGKLFCLAVAGAKIEEKIAPIRSQAAVAIDGCGMLCAKKVLDNAGFSAQSINLGSLGFEKGKSSVTPELVEQAVAKMAL